MSIAFMNMSHTGIVYTISMSCSILLQYLLQTNINNDNLVLYSLLLITFAAAFMNLSGAVRNLNDNIQEDFFNSKSPGKRQFITVFTAMLFIIVLFEYIGNFLSYPLLSLIFEGTPLVYDTPRLFIIISYIVMGVFADLKDMRYIPVITLTGVLIGILNPVLMHDGSSMYVNTCIYYVNAGIINSFFTLIMFKLARGQRHAPLIAVSGRIIDSFFSFVFISPIILKIPVVYTVGIELVCIIIIMLLLSFTGQLSFEQNKQYAVQHISPADFSKRFGLSNKESEVFLTAINFDGTMSELAKSMFMSRSVLYRNISNICDKTGCDSFQEVKRLYYELPSEDISPVDNESSLDESNTVDTTNDFTDKISRFANKYSLTDSEMQTLKIFLENPFKKQKELADMQDITLRTVQRHLANIKAKTNSQSLDEISELFYSKTNFNL
ncbi:MAG: hypothetical protein IJ053_02160 [Lachnospiraceae bacterium]|nr:hypothetical protein [Lachnospiraceae bacterium]